jgi:transposase
MPPATERTSTPLARAGGRPRPGQKGTSTAHNEALGRSRGGLTSKLHLAVDGRGRSLWILVTGGRRHDSTHLQRLLDGIRVPRPGGKGRPRERPAHLVGDKGYSYATCRRCCVAAGSPTPSPERSDQRARRRGRPPVFDRQRYRGRNVVERCAYRLKQWRGIATCFDKRAGNYRAGVVLAGLLPGLA